MVLGGVHCETFVTHWHQRHLQMVTRRAFISCLTHGDCLVEWKHSRCLQSSSVAFGNCGCICLGVNIQNGKCALSIHWVIHKSGEHDGINKGIRAHWHAMSLCFASQQSAGLLLPKCNGNVDCMQMEWEFILPGFKVTLPWHLSQPHCLQDFWAPQPQNNAKAKEHCGNKKSPKFN